MTPELIKAISVTFELCGNTEVTDGAAEVLTKLLDPYPEPAVTAALERCVREVRGRLSTADIISRIDDGRPSGDEAWGLISFSEDDTFAWTEEMAVAFHTALQVENDRIAARRTFLKTYERLCLEARSKRTSVKWSLSLGRDASRREGPIRRALAEGKICAELAEKTLNVSGILGPGDTAKLNGDVEEPASPEQIRDLLGGLQIVQKKG